MTSKEKWLAAAEVIDALRLIPRAIILAFIWIVLDAYLWMKGIGLSNSEKVMVFTGITSAATIWLTFYLNSGRKWKSD